MGKSLAEMLRAVKREAGGAGCAILMRCPEGIAYGSTCEREGVVGSLKEWMVYTAPKAVAPASPSKKKEETKGEDPFAGFDRINLQRLCARLGQELGADEEMCLFLFDVGAGGNMAYWTNMPDTRHAVRAWLQKQEHQKRRGK